MNQKIVITINREHGSGGRKIGQLLAESLGIEYYDKDLINMAVERSGINADLFSAMDEKVKSGFFAATRENIYRGDLYPPTSKEYTSDENLFNIQADLIKRLAADEPCVIVGRCADFILKDSPNVVSVFIHAPKSYLMDTMRKKKSLSEDDLWRHIEKVNRERGIYYKYHTGLVWADAHHYDICMDASKLDFGKFVDIIKGYMKVRFDGLEF